MAADYYRADTEHGDHMDDPSEDGLFMLLGDLKPTGNTFLTITPAHEGPAWRASVTLLAPGTYAVECRDAARGEADQRVEGSPDDIARELTLWLAARDRPGRR
jgi:hypothetical protein